MGNKLVIAAAGSGKTTHIIHEALKITSEKILITTYTQANQDAIKEKIYKINKCIPPNITVQTWFSFLLKEGVRPFQGCMHKDDIPNLILVNAQSGLKFQGKYGPVYYSEKTELKRHYFNKSGKIYSDKLAKFVYRCNEKTKGEVINRLTNIYPHIFIDEIQDLAGYDLELLKLLFESCCNTLLVGDPRQGTYSTNSASKNKQFRKSKIVSFFDDDSIDIEKDEESLLVNYRCHNTICNLSNTLFPDFPETKSGNKKQEEHQGVYIIKKKDVENYLKKYNPVQLRDSSKTKINNKYKCINFGKSKGLTFERVLIYPTEPIKKWIKDRTSILSPTGRSKFYVALTRAIKSVCIVMDYKDSTEYNFIVKYIME